MTDLDRQKREDMHGDEYVQKFTDEQQAARVSRLVRRIHLPEDARVLDVGCGTGLLATLLSSRYGKYVGVDFSEAMLQRARLRVQSQGLGSCEFLCMDAIEHMHASESVYDAIFMLDISEHVPDGEWSGIVAAAQHSLKPGGKVYLHTPNLSFILERLKQLGVMRQFPEHIAVRDAKANAGFFHEAGFSNILCESLPHYNILRWLHPLSVLPLIGRYFAARLWIVARK